MAAKFNKPEKCIVIHALPTCGKTTLVAKLRKQGIAVIETDEIISVIKPEWFSNELWKTHSAGESLDARLGDEILNVIGDLVAYHRRLSDPDALVLVLTNRWGDFLRNNWPLDFSVGRKPQDMFALAQKRGSVNIDLDRCTKWHDDWLKASLGCDRVQLLEDRYLSDVIDEQLFLSEVSSGDKKLTS